MKLLLENWKKYLKEQEEEQEYDYDSEVAKEREELEKKYFGASASIGELLYNIYSNEIKELENQGWYFDDIIDAHDNIFKRIQRKFNEFSKTNKIESNKLENSGRGSFRAVFSCDKDFVIKIDASIDGSGKDMNKEDQQLGINKKYGDIFPRVYKYDPSYKWIVAEKVKEIKTEVYKINSYFPNLYLKPDVLPLVGHTRVLQLSFEYKIAQMQGDKKAMNDCLQGYEKMKSFVATNPNVTLDMIVNEFNKLPIFYKIVSAAFEHGIEIQDAIRPGNMGIGNDKRLVILDSSIEQTLNQGRAAF